MTSQISPSRHAKRAGKACEACRVRRTKCIGGVPCTGCRLYDRDCIMRQQARRRRSATLEEGMNKGTVQPTAPTVEYFSPVSRTLAIEGRVPRLPIHELETAVMIWLSGHGASDIDLRLGATSHLDLAHGASLFPQPQRDEYEKKLIDALIDSSAVTSREFIGSNSLTSLYELYRALPHSLTADCRALLYASFCISSFNVAHTQPDDEGLRHIQGFHLGAPREDITYYNMTMEELLRWNQPSVPACWALQLLMSWASSCGGAEEMCSILGVLTDYVKKLGLHRKATAALYRSEDRVDHLLYSCFYSNAMEAALSDRAPYLNYSEIDLDLTKLCSELDLRGQVAIFESQLLEDMYCGTVDVTSVEYVLSAESRWSPLLRKLRTIKSLQRVPETFFLWANVRCNWLRVLLRAPCLSHPVLAASSSSVLASAASQILYTYRMLSARNRLNPSHSQIRRIVTTGHIVLLCRDANEIHQQQATELLGIVNHLLLCHVDSWPEATRLIDAFRAAAAILDIHYETINEPLSVTSDPFHNVCDMSLPVWKPWEADLLSQILGNDGSVDAHLSVGEVNGISPLSTTTLL